CVTDAVPVQCLKQCAHVSRRRSVGRETSARGASQLIKQELAPQRVPFALSFLRLARVARWWLAARAGTGARGQFRTSYARLGVRAVKTSSRPPTTCGSCR